VKINLAYKFRLYPDEEQAQNLKQKGGNCRFVWNNLLSFSNEHKESTGRYLTRAELQEKEKALRAEHGFLKLSYSQSTQYQCYILDKAVKKAFSPYIVELRKAKIKKAYQEPDLTKQNKKVAKALLFGFPKFKKKHAFQDSIHHPQNFEIKRAKIKIPKLGWVRFRKHREIKGVAKNVTIAQEGGQWFLAICCERQIEPKPVSTENVIGVDVGLKEYAVFSDGTKIANPRLYRKAEAKIKRVQRQLSKMKNTVDVLEPDSTEPNTLVQKKKPNQRKLAKQKKLAALHRKVKNKRKDFLHQLTNRMITKYDGFVLEDLSSKNMMQNHKVAKSIGDASWSMFARFLEYKCLWNGKHFEKIDRWCPTSQICHGCKHRQPMPLSERVYDCGGCGIKIDRDLNASLNILAFSSLGK